MDEHEAAGADEALDPARAALGVLARGERARHRGVDGSSSPASCSSRVARPASVPGSRSPSATRRERLAPGAREIGVLEQRERGVDAVDRGRELRAGLLVGADARAGQADRDAQDDPPQHLRDRGRVAAADVAVAEDAGQRRDGGHQVGGVAVQRGAVGERAEHGLERGRQVGEQDRVGERRPARRRSPPPPPAP